MHKATANATTYTLLPDPRRRPIGILTVFGD